jgi:RNA polymerase sigma factor (sigma-70 family)
MRALRSSPRDECDGRSVPHRATGCDLIARSDCEPRHGTPNIDLQTFEIRGANGVVPEAATAEELARRYSHRVRFYVGKISREFMIGEHWRDELTSAGYWGLAKALSNRRHDATGPELSAYVSRRISGAILDEARSCLTRSTRRELASENLCRASDVDTSLHPILPALVDRPDRCAERRQTRRVIERAIAGLPEGRRRIARAILAGESLGAIAIREGINESTMRARFRVIALSLRKRVLRILHPG